MLSSKAAETSSVVAIECYSKKQNEITVSIELVCTKYEGLPRNPENSARFAAGTHSTHVAGSGKDQPTASSTADG